MRRIWRRFLLLPGPWQPRVATTYQVLDRIASTTERSGGWRSGGVAEAQHAAYGRLLDEMRAGQPRRDFVAAGEALRFTGHSAPSVLEVGCGSGYYSAILPHMSGQNVSYCGLDISLEMVELAKATFPDRPFLAADGAELPFRDRAFDVVWNGVSLMHVLRFKEAIKESSRVTRRWCVFHTVPVVTHRATTLLRHRAYGADFVEHLFNETELLNHFRDSDLVVRHSIDSIPYDLSWWVGEPTSSKTYVCERRDA